jgi:hypothetical protein
LDRRSSVVAGRVASLAADTAAATVFVIGPEAQRVKAKFRAGAHRENIANDSANAGGGAWNGSIALG